MKNKSDFWASLILIGFCIAFGQQIYQLTPSLQGSLGYASVPKGVHGLLCILTGVLLVNSQIGRASAMRWPEKTLWGRLAAMAALVLTYVLGFVGLSFVSVQYGWPSGLAFSTMTFLFVSLSQWLTGFRNLRVLLPTAIAVTGCIYGIFVAVFDVPLP